MLDGVVVYEELGRALAPSPHFVSCGDERRACSPRGRLATSSSAEWLPRIVDRRGDRHAGVARAEPRLRPRGRRSCAPSADGDGFVLDGTKRHVPFAQAADRARSCSPAPATTATSTCSSSTRRPTGVDAHAAASRSRPTRSTAVDLRRRAGARRRPRSAPPGTGWATWDDDDARRHHPARRAGDRRRAATRSTSPCSTPRTAQQFDKPLGAFQALAHYLADAVDRPSTARETLVYEAAWARAERPARSTGSRRWRSCSRARRSATSPRWPSRSSAASASPSSTTSSSTSAGPSSSRSRWWDDRYLEELIAADVLDTAPV